MLSEKNAGVGAAGEWVQQQLGLTSVLQKHGRHHVGPHGSVRSVSRVGLLPKEKYARLATIRSRMRAESVDECGPHPCVENWLTLPSRALYNVCRVVVLHATSPSAYSAVLNTRRLHSYTVA